MAQPKLVDVLMGSYGELVDPSGRGWQVTVVTGNVTGQYPGFTWIPVAGKRYILSDSEVSNSKESLSGAEGCKDRIFSRRTEY